MVERHLEEAREQQRLIVEYPDLNGPVNKELSGEGLASPMLTFPSELLFDILIRLYHDISTSI